MRVGVEELNSYRKHLEALLQTVPLLTRTEAKPEQSSKPSRAEQKRERERELKRKQQRRGGSTANSTPKIAKKGDADQARSAAKPEAPKATLLFSKIAFGKGDAGKKSRLPKDPKQALVVVEKKRAALQQLTAQDPDAAERLVEKDAWSKAIDKAQGIAVRDDARLLKKSLARKSKLKERSKKTWEERKQKAKDDERLEQRKRRDNIQARKEARKDKKSGKKTSGKRSKGRVK